MIWAIVTFQTLIQGNKLIGKNKIKIHKIKDTAAINQISIIVGYTLNKKVKPFCNKFATVHTQNVNMLY